MAEIVRLPSVNDRFWNLVKSEMLRSLLRDGAAVGPGLVKEATDFVRRSYEALPAPEISSITLPDQATGDQVMEACSLIRAHGMIVALSIAVQWFASSGAPPEPLTPPSPAA